MICASALRGYARRMQQVGTVGEAERAPARRWFAALASVAAGLLVLAAVWLFAVLAWRVRWPGMLIAFVAIGWPLVVAAWRPVLPAGWRWTLALAAVLDWIDLLLDWWLESPSDRELAAAQWEAGKIVAIVAASFVAARLPTSLLVRRARAAFIALSCACTALLAGLILFIAIAGPRDHSGKADAALVLGREFFPDGSLRPEMIARVDRAAELYRSGLVAHLVLSGGAGVTDAADLRTEAGVMRELLLERGVPTESIKLDMRARSTEENFACSVPILAELHAHRVLVVTDPWHMPRALYQGSRYARDIELLAAPATASPEWQRGRARVQHLVSESVAYLFERIHRIGGSPVSCPQE